MMSTTRVLQHAHALAGTVSTMSDTAEPAVAQDVAREWARRTRATQRLPELIRDEGALDRLAAIIENSVTPLRDDEVGVKKVPASHWIGENGHPFKQGRNDRTPPVVRERRPRPAEKTGAA
jgi:hypothetical protein